MSEWWYVHKEKSANTKSSLWYCCMVTAKEALAHELFSIGAVKLGEFKLKSGLLSPIYVDLRILVSYPATLKKIAHELNVLAQGISYSRVAGLPYAAIAIATAMSIDSNKPMIYPRKEVKDYGTKKPIEGVFNKGDVVLVVDDLITTGDSKTELIAPLTENGLIVKDIVVILDREQGGKAYLKEHGFELHALLGMREFLLALKNGNKITSEQYETVAKYIASFDNK